MTSLSVIIPVFNDADNLDACLSALARSAWDRSACDGSARLEVIVVDDGSREEAAAAAEAVTTRHGYRFSRLSRNAGPAAARNHGVRMASGTLLFFLDSDVLVEPRTLTRVVEAFDADPSLAALFGSYQADTVPDNFISRYKNLLHHYTHQISSADASTFCGGFGAVRREVFEAMRGFDESQRALEDVELGYRMHLAGHRIRLDRDLHFTHLKHYTLYGLMRSDLLNRAIPWTHLMRRMRIVRNDLNTRASQVASVAVALLIPGTLPLVLLTRPALWPLLLTTALVVCYAALNWHFLAYVGRLRGVTFALRTLAMHWWFHVYSAAGLAIGVVTSDRPPQRPSHSLPGGN